MWAIQATVIKKTVLGDQAISIPTFYLDENVQGFFNETGAINCAESIINPLELDMEVCITAMMM